MEHRPLRVLHLTGKEARILANLCSDIASAVVATALDPTLDAHERTTALARHRLVRRVLASVDRRRFVSDFPLGACVAQPADPDASFLEERGTVLSARDFPVLEVAFESGNRRVHVDELVLLPPTANEEETTDVPSAL